MLWKIYFWTLFILTSTGLFTGLGNLGTFTVGDWIGTANTVLLVIGTYSFAFSRKFFASKNWKTIFWIMIAFIVLNLAIEFDTSGSLRRILYFLEPYDRSTDGTKIDSPVALITFFILIIPAHYIIYKLAYKK